MKLRQIIGGIVLLPSIAALPLVGISSVILHLYTAIVAYGLTGPGVLSYFAAGGVLMLPVIGEIAVFIGAWSVTGNLLNGYSEWLFLWLVFVALLLGLMALGTWIGKTKEES
jgi:hypothetical protein